MRERKIEQNNTGASLEQFPKPLWHEDLAKWNRTRKNICKDEDKILSKREWFEYQSVRRSPWVKEWSPQILFIDWPLWSGYRKSSVTLRHSFVRKIWSSKKKKIKFELLFILTIRTKFVKGDYGTLLSSLYRLIFQDKCQSCLFFLHDFLWNVGPSFTRFTS